MKNLNTLAGAGGETSLDDMIASGTYRFTSWVERAWHDWADYRRDLRAIRELGQQSDSILRDIGLTRSDLTVQGLRDAANRRDQAAAAARRQCR